jgi:hypothetical protein
LAPDSTNGRIFLASRANIHAALPPEGGYSKDFASLACPILTGTLCDIAGSFLSGLLDNSEKVIIHDKNVRRASRAALEMDLLWSRRQAKTGHFRPVLERNQTFLFG